MQIISDRPTFLDHAVPERRDFYRAIDVQSMTPLWEVMGDLVPREPRTPCVPVHWPWQLVRARLVEAGELITAHEAERRVLVFENPGLRGRSAATHSMYAGMQMILPGEVAPSHRHTASAIRLVVEGEGGYTGVDGERTPMFPGDFIITPSWTFHDHGNAGDNTVIWLDGLDVPIVQAFDAAFSEQYHEPVYPDKRPPDDFLARYSGHLLPVDYRPSSISPVVRYPYESVRPALAQMLKNGPIDATHGVKLRYSHPGTGGWPTPTLGAFMQLLPHGFLGGAYRSTDASVLCVVEGHGRSLVGEQWINWAPHDVFVVPSWLPVRHEAHSEAVLFSMSDRPAQQALGLWREAYS